MFCFRRFCGVHESLRTFFPRVIEKKKFYGSLIFLEIFNRDSRKKLRAKIPTGIGLTLELCFHPFAKTNINLSTDAFDTQKVAIEKNSQ